MSDVIKLPSDKKYIQKSKNWATLVYSDSTPNIQVVINYLTSHFLKFAVSPLHNKDTYEVDNEDLSQVKGEPKKEHRHILLIFDTPKSKNQLMPILEESTCVGLDAIGSRKLYFEYLWHKNEIFKPHYDPEEVQLFNCSESDFYGEDYFVSQIVNDIISNKIGSFTDLNEFYILNGFDMSAIQKVVRKNSYYLSQLLKEQKLIY